MRRFALALVIFPVPLFSPVFAADKERITDFDSDIVFAQDGSVKVTDTISIVSAGETIKHGLYFDLPDRLTSNGEDLVVPLSNVTVTRDGQPEPFHLVTDKDHSQLTIGDKDTLLPAGPHSYVVTYSAGCNAPGHVKMLISATGPGWSMLIDKAHADIRAPGRQVTSAVAYIGTDHSFKTEVQPTQQNGDGAKFDSGAPIIAGDQFLIGVDIEPISGKGAI